MKNSAGFTFIEVLIVVAIVLLLATAVIITVNPAKRFEEARDMQREIHLQTILNAIELRKTIERGWPPPCEEIPHELDATNYPIFKTIGSKAEPGFYDLYKCLVPIYLSTELFDPLEGSKEDTKYQIWQNPYSKRVTLLYLKGEKKIVAGPTEYWVVTIPTVITFEVTNITYNSAKSGGEVTDEGISAVSERGVVWHTSQTPTIYDNRTTDGSRTGVFYSDITGLEPDTKYFLRAYARNDIGVGYGTEKEFLTCTLKPRVKTLDAINVRNDTATIQGEITCLGIDKPTRYFEWGPTPVYGYKYIVGIGGLGVFSADLTGLVLDQTYYFRACAQNSAGIQCGDQKTFKTVASKPYVTTTDPYGIGGVSAYSGGYIISDGGKDIIAKGVCWSAFNTYPEINVDSCTNEGTGSEPFTSKMIGLNPGTTYHVRAYATNEIGTGYGERKTFSTLVILPTLNTNDITNITGCSADSGGRIISDGGGDITAKGVCWNKTGIPTNRDACTNDGKGTEPWTSHMTGLLGSTKYYVRAYATNRAGTNYGDEKDFPTAPAAVPSLTTTKPFNIDRYSADSGGNVITDGGLPPVTARGVCWSSFGTPDISDDCASSGTGGLGSFTIHLTGLNPGTTYYVRAYATNSVGTGYGDPPIKFITQYPDLPIVTTKEPYNITYNSADSGGEVTYDGGDPNTISGVCWATHSDPEYCATCTCTIDRTGEGEFFSHMTGLLSAKIYYVRAYAHNTMGTNYGTQYYFTTRRGPCEGVASGGNPGGITLSCSIKSDGCLAGETTVLKMSALNNAHAELPGRAAYNYYVCCNGNELGTACSGKYDTCLKLSGPTNAHVEKKTQPNYPNLACLSTAYGAEAPAFSKIICNYVNAPADCSSLGPLYTCLASISGDTNAHIGNCNAYPTKVCCANVCP